MSTQVPAARNPYPWGVFVEEEYVLEAKIDHWADTGISHSAFLKRFIAVTEFLSSGGLSLLKTRRG